MSGQWNFNNFIRTSISDASIDSTQTAFGVDDSSQFPALSANQYFYITIRSVATGVREIIRVKSYGFNQITDCERGIDGTVGSSFVQGDAVLGWIPRILLDDIGARNPMIRDTSIANHADGSITGSVQNIIDFIDGNPRTLEIETGVYQVTSLLTIPSNIQLIMHKGAIFDVSGTLVIEGEMTGSLSSHFSGAGSVTFSDTRVDIRPAWFGAVGDGVTDDFEAIQNSIASVPSNGSLKFTLGEYLIIGNLAFPDIRLIMENNAVFNPGPGNVLTFSNTNIDSDRHKIINIQTISTAIGTLNSENIFCEWFGADGSDAFIDSRDSIQVALNFAANSGGVKASLGKGRFRISEQLNIGDRVVFAGDNGVFRDQDVTDGTILEAGTAAVTFVSSTMIVETSQPDSVKGLVIEDMAISGGRTAITKATRGINLQNIKDARIRNLFMEDFEEEAILFDGLDEECFCLVENVIVENAVQFTGLPSNIGAITLRKRKITCDNITIKTPLVALAEAGRRLGFIVGSPDNIVSNVVIQRYERGLLIESGGISALLDNVKVQDCLQDGFQVDGFYNQIDNCTAQDCGRDADNTYSGFIFTEIFNVVSNCIAVTFPSTTNDHQYGFSDLSSSVGNRFDRSCISVGHQTAPFNDNPFTGSFSFNPEGFRTGQDDPTPDVDEIGEYTIGVHSSDTTITDLDNMRQGQEVILRHTGTFSDPKTIINNTGQFDKLPDHWQPNENETIKLKKLSDGTIEEVSRTSSGLYRKSIRVNVGALTIGTHNLFELPANAVVKDAIMQVNVRPASATNTATLSMDVEVDDVSGILVAAPVSNAFFDVGSRLLIPRGSDDTTWTNITTSVNRNIQLVVAVEDLTDGNITFHFEYFNRIG